MANLQIINKGKMWRVIDGATVLAFASTISLAETRRKELMAEKAAERVAARKMTGGTACLN